MKRAVLVGGDRSRSMIGQVCRSGKKMVRRMLNFVLQPDPQSFRDAPQGFQRDLSPTIFHQRDEYN